MKVLFLVALVLLPIVLTQDYAVPDLYIDNSEADCTNVNQLLVVAEADSARLANYANVTIPDRLGKLNDALASIQKTCKIIQYPTPSLVQFTKKMSKKKMQTMSTLKSFTMEAQILANAAIGSKDPQQQLMLNQIKTKIRSLQTETDPQSLCSDAVQAVNNLIAYLNWLGPAVYNTYVNSICEQRIQYLSNLQNTCSAASCSTGTSGSKTLFQEGDHVALQCMGSIVVSAHTWLDSLTYTGGVQLSPSTDGVYTGTHWSVHLNDDGTYSFQSLGDYYNPSFQWLDGRTGDGSVGLAPVTTGGYSGTHWDVELLDDGTYSLKCMGSDYNPSYLYLDGRTVDGSVGLAPVTTGGYTGTHWKIVKVT